ncbi:hypothetical protein BCR33DRAFT_831667 [Rhizoclosmatium globosum]|uniref:Uncharacterized protein n=1 Tax=Rhizoclosmatium globosum TaxID=329046 RepID=A0A1Y1ZH32_9FUNG|nr:hypothetical protein BCR33DRAFT_831667 [Rhizoclosmatium globosum]|eukprot:ORY09561.1 hypothetical protein BCR33DRAFT_831667 [Rhizoclosmatium globosum]
MRPKHQIRHLTWARKSRQDFKLHRAYQRSPSNNAVDPNHSPAIPAANNNNTMSQFAAARLSKPECRRRRPLKPSIIDHSDQINQLLEDVASTLTDSGNNPRHDTHTGDLGLKTNLPTTVAQALFYTSLQSIETVDPMSRANKLCPNHIPRRKKDAKNETTEDKPVTKKFRLESSNTDSDADAKGMLYRKREHQDNMYDQEEPCTKKLR